MVRRNSALDLLKPTYLFPEIQRHKNAFLQKEPTADLISLGIGDTTEPLPKFVAEAMRDFAEKLATPQGYQGYGPEQGDKELRELIALKLYNGQITTEEVFVSDGSKCDIGRLQMLFGANIEVAVQDPSYPVYVDGSLLQGVKALHFLPCRPDNDFFPDLKKALPSDLIYFCSPNNPTGKAASKNQLEELVQFARQNKKLIIFDAAYSSFITDPSLPRSIFEIDGSREVAIETHSFSKLAGFTGVRLGWTIVPKELTYEGGKSVHQDWNRVMTTIFNGASIIAQAGGKAVLNASGLLEVDRLSKAYLTNAQLLKSAIKKIGLEVFGGDNAPYLWIKLEKMSSWEAFHHFLEKYHIVTTPGVGFGPAGEGFLRMSAFSARNKVEKAIDRLLRS